MQTQGRADTPVYTFLPLLLLPFLPDATTFFSCAYFHVQCTGIGADEAQYAEQRTRQERVQCSVPVTHSVLLSAIYLKEEAEACVLYRQ